MSRKIKVAKWTWNAAQNLVLLAGIAVCFVGISWVAGYLSHVFVGAVVDGWRAWR